MLTNNTERAQTGWGFWLWWMLASSAGGAVGVFVAVVVFVFVIFSAALDVVGGTLLSAVLGAVLGASLGIAQWLVLRRQVSRAGWWVLANTVAFAVGGLWPAPRGGPCSCPWPWPGMGQIQGVSLSCCYSSPSQRNQVLHKTLPNHFHEKV